MQQKLILIIVLINSLFSYWEIMSFPTTLINGLLVDQNTIFVIVSEGDVYRSTDDGE